MHHSDANYPDSAVLLSFDDDNYSQGYGQFGEVSRALTKDYILQPYMFDIDFRLFKNGDDIGYNLYVFDIRWKKNLKSAQPIEVNLKFQQTFLLGYTVMFQF